jgi:hypothetical protein
MNERRQSNDADKRTTEWSMPQVSGKLYPGRFEQQKAELAQAIVKDITPF